MRIIFLGTPNFAVPSLRALNEKYEIALVISQPNRVKRKGKLIDTPVAECAKELGLTLFQPEAIKDEYEYIKSFNADVMVTAAYGQYIPSKILKLFKKCINVHGSLLPMHRGGAPIQRCLINGDEYTGVTIMQMAKRLDAGRMYSVAKYKIEDDDNASILFDKLSIIGRDLLMASIEDIYNEVNLGVEQDENLVTYSPNIDPSEERIDIRGKASDIVNQIRGLAMEPGAYLEVGDIKLKVFKASTIDLGGDEAPGTVLQVKKGIAIKAGDKAISLDLVLMPGKKIMSGRDFSNGQKIFTLGEIIK